jgi:hypothetical protein
VSWQNWVLLCPPQWGAAKTSFLGFSLIWVRGVSFTDVCQGWGRNWAALTNIVWNHCALALTFISIFFLTSCCIFPKACPLVVGSRGLWSAFQILCVQPRDVLGVGMEVLIYLRKKACITDAMVAPSGQMEAVGREHRASSPPQGV